MKAFLAATCLLFLVLGAVIGFSLVGEARLDALSGLLPAEGSGLTEADAALAEFIATVEDGRLLLGLLYSHERIDTLLNAAACAAAAARSGEEGEYALLLAEIKSLLQGLRRDLAPNFADII